MSDYLKQINPHKTTLIIDQILEQAREKNTPIIREDAIHFMIQLIKVSGVKKVLEIGSAIGYSSIMIATFTEAEVLTIERDEEISLLAKKNIINAKLESKITLVNEDALEYNIEEDYQCDLLFIDASKSSYIKFFEKYEKHVKRNGIIITDNLLFHGFVEQPDIIESKNKRQLVRKINRFNEYLMQRADFDSYIYEIGDGFSISIRK